MTVFFDTNVLVDVLARREGFYDDAFALWSLAEHRKIGGHVSAISFNNIHYLVKKTSSAHEPYNPCE